MDTNTRQLITRYSAQEIHARVQKLGKQISRDFKGTELQVIGVLSGAFVFLADLVRAITVPCKIQFVTASSYGDSTTSSGIVNVEHAVDVRDADVLVVDDILDTGRTLSKITEDLTAQQPRSIRWCTLLDKPDRREVEIAVDYNGFTIPDVFVVGYGIDYAERYRELPYIAELRSTDG